MRMRENDPVETTDIGVQQLCATVRRRVNEHACRIILNQDRRPPSSVFRITRIAIAPIRAHQGHAAGGTTAKDRYFHKDSVNGTREQAEEIICRGDRNVCLGQSFQFRHLAGRVSDIRGFVSLARFGIGARYGASVSTKAAPLGDVRLSPAVRLPS